MADPVQTDEHGNAIDRLDTITDLINRTWQKADDQQVTLCLRIAQAKAMVEADDPFAEGMSWRKFTVCHFHRKQKNSDVLIPRPYREVNRLARIGASPDPQAALNEHRANTAERVRQSRENGVLRNTPSSAVDPMARTSDPVPAESMYDELVAAWELATEDERDRFRDHIGVTRPAVAPPAREVGPEPTEQPQPTKAAPAPAAAGFCTNPAFKPPKPIGDCHYLNCKTGVCQHKGLDEIKAQLSKDFADLPSERPRAPL